MFTASRKSSVVDVSLRDPPSFPDVVTPALIQGEERDAEKIWKSVIEERVSVLFMTPSVLQMMFGWTMVVDGGAKNQSRMRLCKAIGESLSKGLAKRFEEEEGEAMGRELWNVYGPTEATVAISGYWRQCRSQLDVVPIGKAFRLSPGSCPTTIPC